MLGSYYPLETEDDIESLSIASYVDDEHDLGTLRFCIDHDEQRKLLLVTVLDACDLPAMDKNGKSDPYVQITLEQIGKEKKRSCSTNVRSNSLNPTFNETLSLPISPEELKCKTF